MATAHSILQRVTIISCILVNTMVYAEGGWYLIGKVGSGVESNANGNNVAHNGELSLLHTQLCNIVGKFDKAVRNELLQAIPRTFGNPPLFCLEGGYGYRHKFIVPFSAEWTVNAKKQAMENSWRLFTSGSLKAFIPLSSRTKFYVKLGKSFRLDTVPIPSLLAINEVARNDITNTVLKTNPMQHWEGSLTSLGGGFVYKLSSRLEVDLSCDGYTNRDSTQYSFAVSLGINYLFDGVP
jgi:hypothetical protein